MFYERIFPNQNMRLKILSALDFIPDKMMIKLQYFIKTGRNLNLKNPERFTEKIQWYKLYYRNSLMSVCADKYRVREYVKSKELENILVPLYGVYENVDEVDFNILPEKFVIKTNNTSKTNILCKDKSKLNIEYTKKKLNYWMHKRYNNPGREWCYNNIKPLIICEKYLEDEDLTDYKFFCFNGVPYCVLVVKDRYDSSGIKKGFFSSDFEFIDIGVEEYNFSDENNKRIEIKKPKNYERMLEIASILSKDFPFVRVDLYNIDGKIFFGELTFYPGSGYVDYGYFDYELGKQFDISRIH